MTKLLLLNGPNLNLLGLREPDKYGSQTLEDVVASVRDYVESHGGSFEALQSNHEGVLIDAIQKARFDGVNAIIINPGALTHTSVGLRDAFLSVQVPFVEVHISNIFAREKFRHHSYLSDIAAGCFIGCGTAGYRLAAQYLIEKFGVRQ